VSRGADLVVVATVDSVSAGRTLISTEDATDVLRYASLNLLVDEVLGGTLDQAPATLLSLQTESAGPEQMDQPDQHLPGQQGLFFLRRITSFGDGIVTHPAHPAHPARPTNTAPAWANVSSSRAPTRTSTRGR